jgi:hypothetical protein
MRTGAASVVVACALAALGGACGIAEIASVAEELVPAPAAVPPPSVAVPAIARPDTPVAAVPPAPAPVPAETVERIGWFLGELCLRMRRGNSAFVARHVDLPLAVRLRDDGPGEAPRFRDELLADATALRASGICADLTWLGAGIEVRAAGDSWIALASGNGALVELELRQTAKGRLRLVRYRQL